MYKDFLTQNRVKNFFGTFCPGLVLAGHWEGCGTGSRCGMIYRKRIIYLVGVNRYSGAFVEVEHTFSKLENASFSGKMRCLRQKRQKKTLAFYVNRIYTEDHSGAKWSEIPVYRGKVGKR